MKILAFESLSNKVSTALMIDGKIISYNLSFDDSKQSEILVCEIEKILKQNNLWYQDLDWIACSKGPASFTGTRISLACARTIRIAAQIPLILMNSCEIIAHKYRTCKTNIFVALQANAEEFFLAKNQQDPQLIMKENLAEFFPQEKFLLCGPAKKSVAEIIKDHQFEISPEDDEVRANLIANLAYYKIINGDINKTIDPLYLRSPNITQRKK